MRAVQYKEFGGPEVLTVGEADLPKPGAGEIRIAVEAASVNPADWKTRLGLFGSPDLPAIPGLDASGRVEELGDGVTGVKVGDAVFGTGRSTFAESAILDSWAIKPENLGWVEAGAIGVGATTAYRVLELLELADGQTIFIDGASGGVGVFAVQLAVVRGATVIASASERNHELLSALGANPVAYGEGMVSRINVAAPQGVDAVFDVIGKTPVEDLIAIAPSPQQVVSIANFTSDEAGIRASAGGGDPFVALNAIAELAKAGTLQVPVQKTYPLDQAGLAQLSSQGGHVRGKLVVTML